MGFRDWIKGQWRKDNISLSKDIMNAIRNEIVVSLPFPTLRDDFGGAIQMLTDGFRKKMRKLARKEERILKEE